MGPEGPIDDPPGTGLTEASYNDRDPAILMHRSPLSPGSPTPLRLRLSSELEYIGSVFLRRGCFRADLGIIPYIIRVKSPMNPFAT